MTGTRKRRSRWKNGDLDGAESLFRDGRRQPDERATEAELDERIGRLNREPPPSFRAPSGPVRRRLGPIAADRHAAPAPGVGLRAIEEQQRAGRARARPDQPEILMAD